MNLQGIAVFPLRLIGGGGRGPCADSDNDGDRKGEEQGPDEDVGGDFDEENQGRFDDAETSGAGRGDEERGDDGAAVVVKHAVDFNDECVEEAEDGAEKGGEADADGCARGAWELFHGAANGDWFSTHRVERLRDGCGHPRREYAAG